MTLGELRKSMRHSLTQAGLDTPDLDSRILLETAFGFDSAQLILNQDDVLKDKDIKHALSLAERRISGEPIDHILGYREFYGRKFEVTSSVLSPRPETELLLEKALNILQGHAASVLELGTGSGAIPITLALENPKLSITTIDISQEALSVAKTNAATHNIAQKISFLCGDWFTPLPPTQFDMIISNPPYIDANAMTQLSPEVQNYDPEIALYGGPDGLDAYRIIASQTANFLEPNGYLLLEIGYDQGESVSKLLAAEELANVQIFQDLSGHDRIISAQSPKAYV